MITFARSTLLALLVLTAVNLHATDVTYRVHSVEDGDTLIVTINNQQEKIQLIGIDAPEDVDNAKLQYDIQRTGLTADQLLSLGKTATDHLKQMVGENSNIIMDDELQPADKYGRIPADVRLSDGTSLSEMMVQAGYAIILKRYPLDEAFKQRVITLMDQAKSDKRGLWGSDAELMSKWSDL